MKKTGKIALLIGVLTVGIGIAVIAQAVSYMWVSLNPSTPPGGLISSTSTSIAFTKIDLASLASSTEAIVINKMAVTNYGTSSTTPRFFSMLYLYDNNMLVASTTDTVGNNTFVFKNFNYLIPTSTARTLTIKGDLGATATSSQTIRMGINNANSIKAYGASTGATTITSGNFPIIGNTFTIY